MSVFRHVDHWLADETPSEPLLYHYTSVDTLGLILTNRTLRLGPYSATNDPRENVEWAPEILLPAGGVSEALFNETASVGAEVDRLLRRGARLTCFSMDREPNESSDFGVLFHRGWARANMWAHYGSAHKGACLVFARDELVERVREDRPVRDGDVMSWGPVHYVDKPLHISLDLAEIRREGVESVLDDLQTRRGVVDELYFHKNTDWASEQEFRIVLVQWNLPPAEWDTPIYAPYGSALRAIVVGAGTSREELSLIRTWLDDFDGVDAVRCQWDRGAPVLQAAWSK